MSLHQFLTDEYEIKLLNSLNSKFDKGKSAIE